MSSLTWIADLAVSSSLVWVKFMPSGHDLSTKETTYHQQAYFDFALICRGRKRDFTLLWPDMALTVLMTLSFL